jgi:zinc protease
VLGDGKSSRLHQRLVKTEQLASSVSATLDANQYASVFEIQATLNGGVDAKAALELLDDELQALGRDGPSPAELGRAKRRLEFALARDLQLLNGPGGESGRAGTLQRLNHYLGDPGRLPSLVAKLRAVSSDDVRRALAAHLAKHRRAVATTLPRAAGTQP